LEYIQWEGGRNMPRVVHFEIEAQNPQNAKKFYESVFGWKIEKWGGSMDYWLISTGETPEPGIDGAIKKRDPQSPPINTIGVPSVDDFLKKIEESDGTVLAPKSAIPGIGWFAMFRDPEGNVLGIMQDDKNAK
jgi:predicted enzyme related to lactoylglutathione lyase